MFIGSVQVSNGGTSERLTNELLIKAKKVIRPRKSGSLEEWPTHQPSPHEIKVVVNKVLKLKVTVKFMLPFLL